MRVQNLLKLTSLVCAVKAEFFVPRDEAIQYGLDILEYIADSGYTLHNNSALGFHVTAQSLRDANTISWLTEEQSMIQTLQTRDVNSTEEVPFFFIGKKIISDNTSDFELQINPYVLLSSFENSTEHGILKRGYYKKLKLTVDGLSEFVVEHRADVYGIAGLANDAYSFAFSIATGIKNISKKLGCGSYCKDIKDGKRTYNSCSKSYTKAKKDCATTATRDHIQQAIGKGIREISAHDIGATCLILDHGGNWHSTSKIWEKGSGYSGSDISCS